MVINICSNYLVHPFELGKLTGYSKLPKRLKSISYFTNKTINRFRAYIKNNGTTGQKRIARNLIKRFLGIRNTEFDRYIGPKVQNLEKLGSNPKLKEHLDFISKYGNFPDKVLEGYHEYPRISDFNKQFRHIEKVEKIKFIKRMLSTKIINKINPKDCQAHKSICSIIELSRNNHYSPSDILPTHNSPSHEAVLDKILEKNIDSIGTEIPVWSLFIDKYLTGHIDLILCINDIIYVVDYKPEETPHISSRISYSFIRSIPQVSSYALVLEREFSIKNIKCITFNKEGAWIYNPNVALEEFNEFIKKNKTYRVEDRPWEEFFLA